MKKSKKEKKGFSAIEVAIGMVIVAVLAAAASSYILDYTQEAKDAVRLQNTNIVNQAIAKYFRDKMQYPRSLEELKGSYLDADPVTLLLGSEAGQKNLEVRVASNAAAVGLFHMPESQRVWRTYSATAAMEIASIRVVDNIRPAETIDLSLSYATAISEAFYAAGITNANFSFMHSGNTGGTYTTMLKNKLAELGYSVDAAYVLASGGNNDYFDIYITEVKDRTPGSDFGVDQEKYISATYAYKATQYRIYPDHIEKIADGYMSVFNPGNNIYRGLVPATFVTVEEFENGAVIYRANGTNNKTNDPIPTSNYSWLMEGYGE